MTRKRKTKTEPESTKEKAVSLAECIERVTAWEREIINLITTLPDTAEIPAETLRRFGETLKYCQYFTVFQEYYPGFQENSHGYCGTTAEDILKLPVRWQEASNGFNRLYPLILSSDLVQLEIVHQRLMASFGFVGNLLIRIMYTDAYLLRLQHEVARLIPEIYTVWDFFAHRPLLSEIDSDYHKPPSERFTGLPSQVVMRSSAWKIASLSDDAKSLLRHLTEDSASRVARRQTLHAELEQCRTAIRSFADDPENNMPKEGIEATCQSLQRALAKVRQEQRRGESLERVREEYPGIEQEVAALVAHCERVSAFFRDGGIDIVENAEQYEKRRAWLVKKRWLTST